MTDNKKRSAAEDVKFIRALATLGLILFYYVSEDHLPTPFFQNFKTFLNGDVGTVCFALFFIIAGFSLYLSYPGVRKPGAFYAKRIKTVLLPFWVLYVYLFLENAASTGTVLSHGEPWCLIFSVLGVDGYLLGKVPTYYLVGGWFLGVLVILNFLYPLLCKTMKTGGGAFVFFSMTAAVYLILAFLGFDTSRSVLGYLWLFCLGMATARSKERILQHPLTYLLSLMAAGALLFYKIPGINSLFGADFGAKMLAVSLFYILYGVGHLVMFIRPLAVIFEEISDFSFYIYLLLVPVITRIQARWMPEALKAYLIVLGFTVLILFLLAVLLRLITKEISKRGLF